MRDIIRNADMKTIRTGIKDGLKVEELSKKTGITVASLKVYYPKKKAVTKKRTVKKKAKTDGESN